MTNPHFDVVIVGGGMVGASMACALGGSHLHTAVIEAVPFQQQDQPSYDARCIALAYGSRRIFQSLAVWQAMQAHATPIDQIHVSDRGSFGVTRLTKQQENVEALGYVIENRHIGQALMEKLQQWENLDLLCPAKVTQLNIGEQNAEITLTHNEQIQTITAKLVIAADGGNSIIRKQLGIESRRWDYGQTAIISTVSPARPHQHTAYERFTDSGPIALLPLSDKRCSLVYTVSNDLADATMALSDQAFLENLQQRFGYRLGGFERIGRRFAYPLALLRSKEHIRHRVCLIGNAAHTLHPIAGQGFNLGIRDVAALAEVISKAEDPGHLSTLESYAQWREQDQRQVTFATDSLARLFSNRFTPLAHARGAGLVLTDIMPPLKHNLAKHAMGIAGRLPRLARGLSL